MNKKKLYIWKLATFLYSENMVMSGRELAEHLNRNKMLTKNGKKYKGNRGIYNLINQTWKWLYYDLKLKGEAKYVAKAFVESNGKYAYK